MYTKDLNHKMTLRLNDELYEFICMASEAYAISPSDYIRQCVATAKWGFDTAKKAAIEAAKNEAKEGFENGIDRKTDINDLL